MQKINCPKCEAKYLIELSVSKKKFRCGKCGHIFTLSAEENTADVGSPPKPVPEKNTQTEAPSAAIRKGLREAWVKQAFKGHTGAVNAVCFSASEETVLSCGDDGTIRLWDVATGQCLQTLAGHSRKVTALSFFRDEKRVLSGSTDQTVRLWDLTSGRNIDTRQAKCSVWTLGMSKDETRFMSAGGDDYSISLWNVAGGLIRTLKGHTDVVNGAVFHPDGQSAVSAALDGTIRVWNLALGTQTGLCENGPWSGLRLNPAGTLALAVGSPLEVCVWDLNTYRLLRRMEGHTDEVYGVTLTTDGRFAASAGKDRTIRFWDLENGTCIKKAENIGSSVWTLSLSPSGRYLVAGSDMPNPLTLIELDWELDFGN